MFLLQNLCRSNYGFPFTASTLFVNKRKDIRPIKAYSHYPHQVLLGLLGDIELTSS